MPASNALGTLAARADAALNHTTIRIAVTGLSRAGKTVFLTSLLNNLLALPRVDTLPRVRRLLEHETGSRLRRVSIVPPGVSATPVFDYAGKLEDLAADAPAWPPRTENVASISLDLELARTGILSRALGSRRVRLEFLDYPGEWLLDLPMLARSFHDWSVAVLDTLRAPGAAAVAEPFLRFLAAFDPTVAADDALIRRGHRLYVETLQACAATLGLRTLQPGRFLRPGPNADAPLFWFFPDDRTASRGVAAGSGAALLRDRFEAYKERMRADLFDDRFASFDRQIVLVDVLGALHAGAASFTDTRRAIEEIALGLRYRLAPDVPLLAPLGATLRSFGTLLGLDLPRRIERVAFVATKADHVPAAQRPALARLLTELVAPGIGERRFGAGPVTFHTAAAVQSTTDDVATVDGREVGIVRGYVLEADARGAAGEAKGRGERAFFAGDLPANVPDDTFWTGPPFAMPAFKPPRIDASGRLGLPHLGLDDLVATLLEDVLR